MKKGIHPQYHRPVKVTCSCGNTFDIGSTLKEVKVEVCSKCHPFWTGNEKILATGQVEKFNQKMAKSATKVKVVKKDKKAASL